MFTKMDFGLQFGAEWRQGRAEKIDENRADHRAIRDITKASSSEFWKGR